MGGYLRIAKETRLRRLIGAALALAVVGAVWALRRVPTPPPSDDAAPVSRESAWADFYAKSAEELVAILDVDNPHLTLIHRLRDLGDPVAIPKLEAVFEVQEDRTTRLVTAAALSHLDVNDTRYFEYLARAAKEAVGSDMPFPGTFDDNGESTGEANPEFINWCRSHGIDSSEGYRIATQDFFHSVMALGLATDRRAVPILAQGLTSPNPMLVAKSAEGLARLQLESAIPSIISAAERAPRSIRPMIAKALVAFDDSAASFAAEKFIEDKVLLNELRRRVAERGPESVFD